MCEILVHADSDVQSGCVQGIIQLDSLKMSINTVTNIAITWEEVDIVFIVEGCAFTQGVLYKPHCRVQYIAYKHST